MSPEELAAAVGEPLYTVGGAHYFHPTTLAKGKEMGLDGFRWYFLGRGGVLGDVEPDVVASAFGYFHPDLVDKIWTSAKDKAAPRDAGRAYMECCGQIGRDSLGDVEGLDAFNAAAETVIAAAERAGLAMFAGIAAEPLADDAPARALQQAAVLRELRGGVHLLAVIASGLTAAQAHAIKRPDDVAMFGYPDDTPEPTDGQRAAHDAAEALTNRLLADAFSVLDDEGATALLEGSRAMHAILGS